MILVDTSIWDDYFNGKDSKRTDTLDTALIEGTRVFSLLASVIETCRKRNITPWPYLAQVIAERRKGNPAPPIAAAIT